MSTIAAHTLGCKVNQYDTQKILSKFFSEGFIEVPFNGPADIYLINSCSVTHMAERKSRQYVAKARKQNPGAQIIVAGCYSRLDAARVFSIPGVTGIIQNSETLAPLDLEEVVNKVSVNDHDSPLNPPKGGLKMHLQKTQYQDKNTNQSGTINKSSIQNSKNTIQSPPLGGFRGLSTPSLSTNRVRRFLVIQNGCEQFCAYCIIPYARGKVWSKPLDEAVAEAAKMVDEEGAREIVLTGINLGTWQVLNSESRGTGLSLIIDSLCQINGLFRLRLSSIEPQYWTDELLDNIKNNPRVCPHFHIPLQNGCDRTLQRMLRPYSAADYALLVKKIYALFPDAAITTDVMVGFPGETDADMEECLSFVEPQRFSDMHIFRFSPRAGTAAADMPDQIAPETAQNRQEALQNLNQRQSKEYRGRFKGKQLEVLWESFDPDSNLLSGLTANYLRVKKQGGADMVGELASCMYLRGDGGLSALVPILS
ncbi:MAG: tRNA (N(6)-L-threonylcarbamoyladenosine(37)-C(2))-methylthiotransferase MtaB [Candidatus Margulisiibacteriota bacterium]